MALKLHSFYTPERIEVLLYPDGDAGEMITKQNMQAECDITNILSQFSRTGILTHINEQEGTYEDLPDFMDLQTAIQVQMEADQAFQTLPSIVREHFANDPGKFLAALGDEKQRKQLTEWGIFKAPKTDPGPIRVEVVNPPSATP